MGLLRFAGDVWRFITSKDGEWEKNYNKLSVATTDYIMELQEEITGLDEDLAEVIEEKEEAASHHHVEVFELEKEIELLKKENAALKTIIQEAK